MKWLIISILAVIIAPAAFAEIPEYPKVVITSGSNYDLVEDYIEGIAVWTSHPQRIDDGGVWKDFIIYNEAQIVQIESASSSLVYDKNTCSYSIYDSGYISPGEEPIIPAVSWMPKIAEVGTNNYSDIDDLYNAECEVSVNSNDDNASIISKRSIVEDLDPVIINHSNGTQSVYPQRSGVTIATLEHRIDFNLERGIKETVTIFNNNPEWDNHKASITQTVHTPDIITIAEQDYDVSSMNGQILDKQWIIDNEAQIFQIADDLNYDFDIGIEQLNAISFVSDGGLFGTTQKIAFDYSVNDITPIGSSYTVDPTLTTTGSGTFDITVLHTHTISSGTIDGVALTSGQISSLQSDINATNQYHTLAGTTLIVYYTVPVAPGAPTSMTAADGVPIGLSWNANTDDGGAALTDYKIFRSTYQHPEQPLPDNEGADTLPSGHASNVDMQNNIVLYHLDDYNTSTNKIEDTSSNNIDTDALASAPTFSDAAIDLGIDNPKLTVSSASIPLSGTNSWTVGAWTNSTSGVSTILSFDNSAGEQGKIEVEPTKLRFKLDKPATLIIDEDFAGPTYTWTSSHSDIGVSNGKLEFTNLVNTVPTSGTNKRISLDLGTPLDQNDWVIRFLYTPTVVPNDSAVMFYMSDEPPTSTANQDQDAIGLTHYRNGGYWQSQVGAVDDSNPMSAMNTNLSPNYSTSANTQYGVQIQRIGGSTVELEVYDNTWTTLHTSHTISGAASSIDGLQYFKVGNIMSGAGAAARSGNIDDLQICSGESNIANCSTGSTSINIEKTGLTIPGDSLSHIALTKNSNDYTFYLNGTSVHTATDTDSLGTISNNKFWIGTQTDGTTNPASQLDEFFINSVAESSTTIDNIFDRGAERFTYVDDESSTSYSDSGVISGNEYTYAVKSFNTVFYSPYSAYTYAQAGVPPDAPTITSISIDDTDAAPLTIDLEYQQGASMGTGTFQNYVISRTQDSTWQTSQTIASPTTTSHTDTVSSPGTYYYKVATSSTHGTGPNSASSTITTPAAPNAITDLGGSADSNVQTTLTWSIPNDGGSALTQFKIFRDSVNIANATASSTSHTDSGLSDNTTYLYNIFPQNNAGTGTISNNHSITTYTGVSGGITGSSTVIGSTAQLVVNATTTGGTPTPTFDTFVVKEGSNIITTFTSTTGYLHLEDDDTHNYTIESTDTNHWQSPTISGTLSGIQGTYDPDWENNASYNYTRTATDFSLTVNRDVPAGWDLNCEYRTTSQAAANQTGTNGVGTSMWAFQDTQSISSGKHVYVSCTEDGEQVVNFVSYGPNLIAGGLNLLDTNFGDYLGVPAALFFVILVAGLFTGRTANTGILVVLALIGVLGFIGMIAIDEATWGFVLIAGVLGLFVGRRFL